MAGLGRRLGIDPGNIGLEAQALDRQRELGRGIPGPGRLDRGLPGGLVDPVDLGQPVAGGGLDGLPRARPQRGPVGRPAGRPPWPTGSRARRPPRPPGPPGRRARRRPAAARAGCGWRPSTARSGARPGRSARRRSAARRRTVRGGRRAARGGGARRCRFGRGGRIRRRLRPGFGDRRDLGRSRPIAWLGGLAARGPFGHGHHRSDHDRGCHRCVDRLRRGHGGRLARRAIGNATRAPPSGPDGTCVLVGQGSAPAGRLAARIAGSAGPPRPGRSAPSRVRSTDKVEARRKGRALAVTVRRISRAGRGRERATERSVTPAPRPISRPIASAANSLRPGALLVIRAAARARTCARG